MRFLLPVLCCAALVALPTALSGATVAPGRVVFPVGLPEPQSNADAGVATIAVALPDGGAVLAAAERRKGLVLAQVRANGVLDPAFGRNGVAHVPSPPATGSAPITVAPFWPLELLRQPDGRLLAVGLGPAGTRYEGQRLVLVRLLPGGALDPTFGTGGIVRPGIQAGCGGLCRPAALQADGSIVLAGTIGEVSPAIEHDPNAPATFQWVVTRLTPSGATDPTFGSGGTVAIGSPGHGGGYGVDVLDGGLIAALGHIEATGTLLTRLLPTGAADPAFHGGAPVAVRGTGAFQMLAQPEGAVLVLTSDRVARFTVAGDPDPGFGTGGELALPGSISGVLVPDANGATLLWSPVIHDPHPLGQGDLVLRRITPDGRFDDALAGATGRTLRLGFGGGIPSVFGRLKPRPLPAFPQTGFLPEAVVRRPDGSLLVAGGVRVARYHGEGAGFGTGRFAAAALTASLVPDPAFGGAAKRPRLTLQVTRQRAASAARLKRIALRATASSPGLALVKVRDGRGRLLAQGVEPLFSEGATTWRVRLTATGGRLLRHGGRTAITVSAQFRDIVSQHSVVHARGALR